MLCITVLFPSVLPTNSLGWTVVRGGLTNSSDTRSSGWCSLDSLLLERHLVDFFRII